MTGTDYSDANTSAQAESLLHGVEQPVGEIDIYMNTNETDIMF